MERRDQFLVLVCDATGLDRERLGDLEGRVLFQKVVYLAQELGYDVSFRYSLYLRGPYCSELADSGYRLLSDELGWTDVSRRMELQDHIKEQLGELARVFGDRDGQLSAGLLELTATVHFLVSHAFSGETLPVALSKAHEWVQKNKADLVWRFPEAKANLETLHLLRPESAV